MPHVQCAAPQPEGGVSGTGSFAGLSIWSTRTGSSEEEPCGEGHRLDRQADDRLAFGLGSEEQEFRGFFMEHPMDPAKFLDKDGGWKKYVSVWRSEFWLEFKRLFGMMEVDYEQGALGHPTAKPTKNGTNYVALESLKGLKADRSRMKRATSTPSAALAKWAPGLRRRLVQAILGPQ